MGRRGKDHLRELIKRENVEIPAVCDILPDVAAEAAKMANSRFYLDYREMLDRESLDAVVIATPAPVACRSYCSRLGSWGCSTVRKAIGLVTQGRPEDSGCGRENRTDLRNRVSVAP